MDRKRVNRYAVLWIKYLPIAAVVCCILNTMGSFFGFNFEAVGYLFNLLVFIGLILLSYVLQFCAWHRCLIWYVLGCQLLNAFDYYIGIPVSNKGFFMIHVLLIGITIIALTYHHVKKNQRGGAD